jgi:hypothetical protein
MSKAKKVKKRKLLPEKSLTEIQFTFATKSVPKFNGNINPKET